MEEEFEFEAGDILFSVYKSSRGDFIGHSLIYAPNSDEEFSKLKVIHAINNEEKNIQDLRATSVPSGDYIVFRCKDKELASKAAEQALKWSEFVVPYDESRKMMQSSITSKLDVQVKNKGKEIGPKERVKFHKKHWKTLILLDAMKNATKADSSLVLPKHEKLGSGRGVRCSMFILQCYQAAALSDFVKPMEYGERCSLKYADLSQLKDYFSPKGEKEKRFSIRDFQKKGKIGKTFKLFKKYSDASKKIHEYPRITLRDEDKNFNEDHTKFKPSILQWDLEKYPDITMFDMEAACTSGLYLHSKAVDISDLVFSLESDGDNWKKFDNIHILQKNVSQEEKKDYQDQVKEHRLRASGQTKAYEQELLINLEMKDDLLLGSSSDLDSTERKTF